MSETADVWYSISDLNKKKYIHYQLSELINNGCCIRCMNNTCNNKEEHGPEFPEQIVYYLNNPLRINIIRNGINDSKLDIDGIPLMYNLCHFIYTNKNCINCAEGRFKTIKIQDKDIKVCYSDLNNIKNKLTIGLHIDVKFSVSNKKINIYEILPYERIDEFKNDQNEYKKDFEIHNINSFPNIGNEIKNNGNVLDYSKIKNYSNDEENKEITYDKTENDYKEIKNNKFNKEKYSKKNDNKFNVKGTSNEYYDLIGNNNSLKKRIYELEDNNNNLKKRIYELEKDLHNRSSYINHKIDEKFQTVEYLNNRIIDQYFKTNLEEYIFQI